LTKSIHIAFLTPEYSRDQAPEGGLGNYLRKTAMQLCHRGHRVSIFCLSKLCRDYRDGEVFVHEVRRFRFPYQLARFRQMAPFLPAIAQVRSAQRLAKQFWQAASGNPVDIVQASSFGSPGYTLRHNGQMPVVCRISSYTPLYRSASGQRRSFGDYLSDWLEVRQVLDAQASFAPSELMASAFARVEGHRPLVIRSPANVDEVSYDPSFYERHLSGQRYLLYFGTLNRIKGVDLLAPVAGKLLPRHPELNLVFIGRDHGLRDGQKVFDFVRQANEAYQSQLFYHPGLLKSQLYPVIKNSLGVLMPSRVDNYPNACLEALSLGIPVVGTYESSLDEMIGDGKTGFLARNDDADSFGEAVERLLSLSPAQSLEMRQQILSLADKMKAEDRIGQLIAFYEQTCAAFRRQP
jgi:glycosyltransferase involved in cell wall biosynthesis